MKSILSSILSLIVSSSSKLPYVSHYSYDFKHGWLNIIVSEYNSQKTCGDIGISNNELQYKLFCGKENRKHVNRISGISLQVTSAKLYLGLEHPSDRENDKQQFSPQYVG